MPKFKIEIEETLQRVENIEANDLEQALEIAKNKYISEEIVLDSTNFKKYNIREYK